MEYKIRYSYEILYDLLDICSIHTVLAHSIRTDILYSFLAEARYDKWIHLIVERLAQGVIYNIL